MEEDDIARLQRRLFSYLDRKKLRPTIQRRAVSDVFFRTGGHLSIDELLALVHARDPKIGYATVYRTMKLLVDSGLASERQFDGTVTRFEVADDSHHDHLICLKCKRIVEFEDDGIERLQDELAERHGYRLLNHKHELYGLCPSCSAREGQLDEPS